MDSENNNHHDNHNKSSHHHSLNLPSSNHSPKRGGGRGGGGRGGRRGRGGGGRSSNTSNNHNNPSRGRGGGNRRNYRKGGRGGNRYSNHYHNKNDNNKNNSNNSNSGQDDDEDVMISFMHLLRSGDEAATKLHQEYEGKQREFVIAARTFLANRSSDHDMEKMVADLTIDDDPPPSPDPSPSVSVPVKTVPTIPTVVQGQVPTPVPEPTKATVHNQSTVQKSTAPNPAQGPAPSVWQPKRIWTRLEQQPGSLLANGVSTQQPSLVMGPRKALLATWKLPLAFLREHTLNKMDAEAATTLTVREALSKLSIGLFRRGCAENGNNSSIISKTVVDFEIQDSDGSIWGTVPFYTPRTPGNVLLRLYFEEDPLATLATSTCIQVCVSDEDAEGTLRFILSNFKAKKGTTNFSSIHSLAAVLQQFAHSNAASRAAWGCICESRKVLDANKVEHLKKKEKLTQQLTQLQEQQQSLNNESTDLSALPKTEHSNDSDDNDADSPNDNEKSNSNLSLDQVRDKINSIMGELASNDRKWREVQSAFASVIRAVLLNGGSTLLLKRDIMNKLKLEYELWCPLCECFAPNPFEKSTSPFNNSKNNNNNEQQQRSLSNNNFPHQGSPEHFQLCRQSKEQMQKEILGFIPRMNSLSQILFHGNNRKGSSKSSAKEAADVIQRLSESMHTLYQQEYNVSASIFKRRELARATTQQIVTQCGFFPNGTAVVVFGSSANGFGSPNSDLDMCLQLPNGIKLNNDNDENGATAMSKLAEKLEAAGMRDVDTSRLTARIPVVMFKFPFKVSTKGDDGQEDEIKEILIDCDLSMQNPLACLNTSLLLCYSNIIPHVRILASIVKRWAKARDINNPSNHTLSSYGYIIMILHFLTTHKALSNGLVGPLVSSSTTNQLNNSKGKHLSQNSSDPGQPIIPNLQWMDQRWLQCPPGVPYMEWNEIPRDNRFCMKHPSETSFIVNTYFHRFAHQNAQNLQRRFEVKATPSVGVLLASFFRYYAFEFDFKKHVVSLNATIQNGLVEREAKAEWDGWKLYGQALCVEDPFETFYDVAHVLKPSNFQRTRREFARAYSKIISSATATWESGGDNTKSGKEIIDWICQTEPAQTKSNGEKPKEPTGAINK